jgi:hypothetical protein
MSNSRAARAHCTGVIFFWVTSGFLAMGTGSVLGGRGYGGAASSGLRGREVVVEGGFEAAEAAALGGRAWGVVGVAILGVLGDLKFAQERRTGVDFAEMEISKMGRSFSPEPSSPLRLRRSLKGISAEDDRSDLGRARGGGDLSDRCGDLDGSREGGGEGGRDRGGWATDSGGGDGASRGSTWRLVDR